ncbi:MAG: hypothetical protein IAI50_13160 [Candidatus Eremiobacteraeota bacterium]|nr:hypothetical protein [Candidatus Eremiobacteraeota bacterium]
MGLALRDQEAFDIVTGRSFDGAHVVSLDLEMQARRLTLELYGPLHAGDRTTYRAKITFFGTSALVIENEAGTFPESVGTSQLSLSYADDTDEGGAELRGRQPWSVLWNFDGLAYEEHAAVLVSLADDLSDR